MDHTHEELTERLRSLGRSPVPDEVSARTRSAMSGRLPLVRRWSRPAVGIAAIVGFVFGSLGLASAGALPTTMQDVAHDVLDRVGVEVPVGTERFNDPTLCPGGPYKNHGDYVKRNKDTDPNAAHSDCGKPLSSVGKSDKSDDSLESDDSTEAPENEESTASDDEQGGGNSNSDNSSNADDAPGQNKDKTKDKVPGPSDGDEGEEDSTESSESSSEGS